MDSQSRQQARMEEIQKKKARLEELRRARDKKGQDLSNTKNRMSMTDRSDLHHPSPNRARDREDINAILASIEGSSPRNASKSRPGSVVSSRPLSGQRLSTGSGENHLDSPSNTSVPTAYVSISTQTAPVSSLDPVQESPQHTKPALHEPRPITYEKATQTTSDWQPDARRTQDTPDDHQKQFDMDQIRQQLRIEVEEEIRKSRETTNLDAPADEAQERYPLRQLTDEEREAVFASQDFQDFVDRSSKIIERALDDKYDLLVDYAQGDGEVDDDDEDGYGQSSSRRGRRVKQVAQYWDERRSKKRMISDICFSPKYPELVLASYTRNQAAPQEPSGLVQVWNSHMASRPEYVFENASSDILTAKFSPFHPKLIIGGCYSGQVLLWDMRVASPNPVQKTPLTGNGHTHPIYSLEIVGTQNANNIISASTDGLVCTWSVDMLAQPQDQKLWLHAPPPAKSEDVAPQCMAFPRSDPTYFLAGTEEGSIYGCHRYERAGAKAGIDGRVLYAGHAAPVLSLDFHPGHGPVDLGDLVLSASMDWTVKLWRLRPAASLGSAVTGTTTQHGPILDMVREDVVYDVAWSPVRPAVFALVDGTGSLEIWDLNADMEAPVSKVTPTSDGTTGAGWARRSLNRVAWENNEGKRVAVGGLDGMMTVFEVGSELGGTEGAKSEEWTGMKKAVTRVEAQEGARAAVNGK